MVRLRILIGAVAALTAALIAAADDGFVVTCPVEGMIDDGVQVLVERAVREAQGAKAIIFVVDTPGGMLDSAIEITKTILEAPCPTIAYITGMGAISAGALISYSCQHIIMASDTNIGAATPVIMSAEGMEPTSEKEVSFMRAKMRALAERNHHNRSIAEAMVDKDVELYAYMDDTGHRVVFAAGRDPESERDAGSHALGPAGAGNAAPANAEGSPEHLPKSGVQEAAERVVKAIKALPEAIDTTKKPPEPVSPESEKARDAETAPPKNLPEGAELVLPKGKLLTLTPREAVDYGLIPITANNMGEVMAYYGYAGLRKHEIVPTWSEGLFRWLTSPLVAGLLLMLGIAGVYMEMKTPGFGAFGIMGIACLGLFFGAHLVIGLANWIDLLLILAGFVLLGIEIFVLPGFGIIGVAGICCLIFGLYLSLTHVTVPQYSWDYQRLEDATLSLLVAVLSFGLFVYALVKAFPHTPLYRMVVQTHSEDAAAGYTVQTTADRDAAIGLKGVALSKLRPVGRGRFGEQTFQVMARGEYIQEGTPIIIIEVEGNRYVVDAMPEGPAQNRDVVS